jgi:endogenous inhibitor of DNA gyrase (YacG/DUF329 family)
MSEPSPDRRKCPLCGKPTATDFRPFCSKRCADIDLGRWLKGNYAIPSEEGADISSESDEAGEG